MITMPKPTREVVPQPTREVVRRHLLRRRDHRRPWAAGIEVAEVRPAGRSSHAHAGKSDLLDAEAAARSVVGRDYARVARPRQNGDRVALHWVGEPADDTRSITYAELQDEVCRAANALVELGVRTGDRVAIYMPMIPETVVAMLACARLGAPHTVVFGGFSADALAFPDLACRL